MVSTISLRRSISRKLFLGMQAFGLLMGLVFPLYARFFMSYKQGLRMFFDIGCIASGLLVGVFSYVLVERIVFRELFAISSRLRGMAEGHGDLRCDITIESHDCIGELAVMGWKPVPRGGRGYRMGERSVMRGNQTGCGHRVLVNGAV